ncbi:MAG: M23 family metallopeptidase [Actinobacteria bacterium]|nr:M23 family metallopeptidase [Actinomycetota bacterium]
MFNLAGILCLCLLWHQTPAPSGTPGPLDHNRVIAEFAAPEPDWLPGHRGLDLAADLGDTVITPRAGWVVHAGAVAGTGVVVIRHGRLRATYQSVAPSVRTGQYVGAGSVLGEVSRAGERNSSAHCTPGCIHWGLKDGEQYLDPRILIDALSDVALVPQEHR